MDGVWSLLPLDIVADIALKVETFEDFIRFSAVCRTWNRASSLIKHEWSAKSPVSWLLLAENPHENTIGVRKCFDISNNNKCYHLNLPQTFGKRCWGSACGWVAMVDREHNVELFNPITKAQISYPSLEATYECAKAKLLRLDSSNVNVEDVDFKEDYFTWFMQEFLNSLIVIKVLQGDHYEFVIMLLYSYNERLAFARHGDQTWTSITVKENGKIFDAIVKDDHVFALYGDGSLVYWDVNKFYSREIVVPIDYCPPIDFDPESFEALHKYEKSMNLVQFDCDLFVVLRFKEELGGDVGSDGELLAYTSDGDDNECSYHTYAFGVFKIDHKSKSWEEIEDLDNLTLFVGDNYSMGVSRTLAKCLKRNCIYFTDDTAEFWSLAKSSCGGLDMGIFDNKSGQKWQLYDGDMCPSLYPSIWFIPHF
ncbi:hypothetical protein RND81_13G167100 [Saponaria officinalis]|uniref:F-box domain-containing protein n=1 Tax=Saponaria officinalis TaxID=3572 RepID=A0AAW1H0U3_SAPOF